MNDESRSFHLTHAVSPLTPGLIEMIINQGVQERLHRSRLIFNILMRYPRLFDDSYYQEIITAVTLGKSLTENDTRLLAELVYLQHKQEWH